MKRSEMVRKIFEIITKKDYYTIEDADELLVKLEDVGMKPP